MTERFLERILWWTGLCYQNGNIFAVSKWIWIEGTRRKYIYPSVNILISHVPSVNTALVTNDLCHESGIRCKWTLNGINRVFVWKSSERDPPYSGMTLTQLSQLNIEQWKLKWMETISISNLTFTNFRKTETWFTFIKWKSFECCALVVVCGHEFDANLGPWNAISMWRCDDKIIIKFIRLHYTHTHKRNVEHVLGRLQLVNKFSNVLNAVDNDDNVKEKMKNKGEWRMRYNPRIKSSNENE